jgi:NAD(P)-dependent dehydrogenase (short-subunit alcohol dehydrogenase family)
MGRSDNRIALITGSARGLGEGIARAFASEGAVVAGADFADAGPVADSLPPSPGGRRGAITPEVSNMAQVDEAAAAIVSNYDSLDILANNAGVGSMAAWIASDEACHTTGATFNLTGREQVFF